jgi:hypothetical protein
LSRAGHLRPKKSAALETRRVLVHGLAYFGDVLAEFMSGGRWEFVYYPDSGMRNLVSMCNALRRCDLVYQIGGRLTTGKFLRMARLLGKKRIVMHWIGSDALEARAAASSRKAEPWILNSIHHWADSPWIFDEVTEMGLKCEYVPLPSTQIPGNLAPLPKEFTVLVYVPSVQSAELYGLDKILEAARALPSVRFNLVGLRDGRLNSLPRNIQLHERIPDLTEYYKAATVVWRPTRHDGLSWMVCEALGHGRHVLWSYPFPGCTQVQSTAHAVEEIGRLLHKHRENVLRVNWEGARFISSSEFAPANFKRNILSKLHQLLPSHG